MAPKGRPLRLSGPTEAAAGLVFAGVLVVEVSEHLSQRKEHHDCGAADRLGCGHLLPCGQGSVTTISLGESDRGSAAPQHESNTPSQLAPGRRRSGADEDLRSQRRTGASKTSLKALVRSRLLDDSIPAAQHLVGRSWLMMLAIPAPAEVKTYEDLLFICSSTLITIALLSFSESIPKV